MIMNMNLLMNTFMTINFIVKNFNKTLTVLDLTCIELFTTFTM